MTSVGVKLTVDEYDAMVARGVFDNLPQKIELILGEIQQMNPAGPNHDYLIEYLTHWSIQNTDFKRIRVRIQSGLSLPSQASRPEPDVLWVKADHPRKRHPIADDVLLLIEVSDSSLSVDRRVKANLYSAAGIQEYWIVNVANETIEIYRKPSSNGYESTSTFRSGECVSPFIEPNAMLNVSELFGEK